MSSLFERILSVTLVGCALTIAASVARREFSKPASSAQSRTEFVKGWEKAMEVGIVVGDKSARVKIVEFADLQCPVCRRFQGTVRELLNEYPKDVALVFVHLPLPGHPFALPAARAAECADTKGRFYPFVQAVFAKQDSLGIKSWGSFASEAGIQDSSEISACASRSEPVKRIESGTALAQTLQVFATPTVIVNGWRFMAPTKENLVRAVNAVRKGRAANKIDVE